MRRRIVTAARPADLVGAVRCGSMVPRGAPQLSPAGVLLHPLRRLQGEEVKRILPQINATLPGVSTDGCRTASLAQIPRAANA